MKTVPAAVVLVCVLAAAAGGWLWWSGTVARSATGANKARVSAPTPIAATDGATTSDHVAVAPAKASEAKTGPSQKSLSVDDLASRLDDMLARAEADRLAGKPLPEPPVSIAPPRPAQKPHITIPPRFLPQAPVAPVKGAASGVPLAPTTDVVVPYAPAGTL